MSIFLGDAVDAHKLLHRRLLDVLNRLEFREECVPLGWADALDIVEKRADGVLRAERAVVFYRKAVDFLLDAPAILEQERIFLQQKFFARTVHKRTSSVAVVLRHAERRDGKPHGADDLLGCADLTLTAVHENEVWEIDESCVAFERPLEAPVQHLLQGAVVVLTVDRLDLETAVVLLDGLEVAENYHCAYRVYAVRVRNVVGFDAVGFLTLAKDCGQRFPERLLLFASGLLLDFERLGELRHVALGELKQRPLLALLRHVY